MGRPFTGGVIARRQRSIQYDFFFEGTRYRPSLRRTPSEANLRRAREHLAAIKERIAAGVFEFSEEFPNFRGLPQVMRSLSERTCGQVFDDFLEHCESKHRKGGMEAVTVSGYRKILDGIWRPALNTQKLLKVEHTALVKIADSHDWSRKTYNNAISALRVAFEFGFRDHPQHHNPAAVLKCIRIRKRDRLVDPFRIHEAEQLIAAIHLDWGEAQGNYDEFRFFTGLRPSEQIALLTSDYDPNLGTLRITKARVAGIDKDCTKTGEDRFVTLCPRALQVLHRQLALRSRVELEGQIDHAFLFFTAKGAAIQHFRHPNLRWKRSLARLANVRYRRPYTARHSSVSWNLMLGRSPLWVSKQHGHSIATMFRAYTAWTEGAPASEIELINQAMGLDHMPRRRFKRRTSAPFASTQAVASQVAGENQGAGRRSLPDAIRRRESIGQPPVRGPAVSDSEFGTTFATSLPTEWRKPSIQKNLFGGKGGTRTLDPGIMSAGVFGFRPAALPRVTSKPLIFQQCVLN
jgi:integrase